MPENGLQSKSPGNKVKLYKMAERFTRFAKQKKITQLLPKINARTEGIQVDERHLLFGEYLQK